MSQLQDAPHFPGSPPALQTRSSTELHRCRWARPSAVASLGGDRSQHTSPPLHQWSSGDWAELREEIPKRKAFDVVTDGWDRDLGADGVKHTALWYPRRLALLAGRECARGLALRGEGGLFDVRGTAQEQSGEIWCVTKSLYDLREVTSLSLHILKMGKTEVTFLFHL